MYGVQGCMLEFATSLYAHRTIFSDTIEIMQQHDTFNPSFISYNILSEDPKDRDSVHSILTYMSSLHGVPRAGPTTILKDMEPSPNP